MGTEQIWAFVLGVIVGVVGLMVISCISITE